MSDLPPSAEIYPLITSVVEVITTTPPPLAAPPLPNDVGSFAHPYTLDTNLAIKENEVLILCIYSMI
jgi:hypothetical protein